MPCRIDGARQWNPAFAGHIPIGNREILFFPTGNQVERVLDSKRDWFLKLSDFFLRIPSLKSAQGKWLNDALMRAIFFGDIGCGGFEARVNRKGNRSRWKLCHDSVIGTVHFAALV
jgi:hypothetical protein